MNKYLQIATALASFIISSSLFAGSSSSLGMSGNQISIVTEGKTKLVTTRGNIPSYGDEETCLSYLTTQKQSYDKTCISYQILIASFKGKFGLFIKRELGMQALVGKTLHLYDFQSKKITNVTYLLPKEIQDASNFQMWYGSYKIGYTLRDGISSYTLPSFMNPSIFLNIIQN